MCFVELLLPSDGRLHRVSVGNRVLVCARLLHEHKFSKFCRWNTGLLQLEPFLSPYPDVALKSVTLISFINDDFIIARQSLM